MKAHDHQKSKVYAWEFETFDNKMDRDEPWRDLDKIEELATEILGSFGITWEPWTPNRKLRASFFADPRLTSWARGCAGGTKDGGGATSYTIAIGHDHRPTVQRITVTPNIEVILHEVAHVVLDQTVGVKQRAHAAHGGLFVRTMIRLFGIYSYTWENREGELIASAKESGLAVFEGDLEKTLQPSARKRRRSKKKA